MDEEFIYQVLAIVSEIPKGKVASYKQIAILADRPKNARQVGKILSHANYYGNYPCHRVVNSAGRLVPHWDEQRALLIQEGIRFKDNGNVDMKRYQWEII
ncbi:MAG: MGMT family protein [Thomasclavelia sp.]